MIFKRIFLRKLWSDGRMGHSTYLMFFLVFVNFILITYNFLIVGNETFEKAFSNLLLFGVIFIIFYFPISILIGRWHTNTQISTDQSIQRHADPLFAKMIRTLLDQQTDKISKKEVEEFRNILLNIEKLKI